MSVYVDPARHPYRGMLMCHMWADSLGELLTMATALDLHWGWIQGHAMSDTPMGQAAGWTHFDVSASKRKRAVALGAIETDIYAPLACQWLRELDGPNADRALTALVGLADKRGRR